jgi:hypothetical protein
MQDTNSSHLTSRSGEGSPAARPDLQTALYAVATAARVYYEGYAQDEAEDGEGADLATYNPYTGCSPEQGKAALALRNALRALDACQRKTKDAP